MGENIIVVFPDEVGKNRGNLVHLGVTAIPTFSQISVPDVPDKYLRPSSNPVGGGQQPGLVGQGVSEIPKDKFVLRVDQR